MQKKEVAIINISSTMSSFVGEKGVNDTFIVKGFKQIEYDGFKIEENVPTFLKDANAVLSLCEMIKNVKNSGSGIKKIYIGVPGVFTRMIVRDGQVSFSKKRKITEKEIRMVQEAGFAGKVNGWSVINYASINFELDDFRKTFSALGETSATLKGRTCYVLCSNYFINVVKTACKECSFNENDVVFVSTPLAESLYLVDKEYRDRLAVLLDVGHLSSDFTMVFGEGLLYQRSFEFGGAHITCALMEELNIDSYEIADKLKNKATISVDANESEHYEIVKGDKAYYFNKNKVKQVIVEMLDELIDEIHASYTQSRVNVPEHIPLYITGGGITHIRGAKERLSDVLGVSMETIAPDLPFLDKPENSSYLSVLAYALKN